MKFPFALALSLLVGCGGNPINGVWLFEVENADPDCETSFTSNVDGQEDPEPGDPGEYTDLSDRTVSRNLFFARIQTGKADDAVMIIGDSLVPGVDLGGGQWQFEFESEVEDIDGREHEDGYIEREIETLTTTETYTITQEGSRYLSGSIEVETEFTIRNEESDRWEADDLFFDFGNLPSFLVGGDENIADESNCSDAICFVQETTKCEVDTSLVGTYTGLSGEATFEVEDNERSPSF